MKNKILLCLSIILFGGLSLNAQSTPIIQDTVFVYDTLYITDTIRINKSDWLIEEELPTLDFSNLYQDENQHLFIFSSDKTATFSINDIIKANNNFNSLKSEKMKKVSFLSLMLVAFQTMVLAQNDISVSLGGGIHNTQTSEQIDTKFAPLFKVGVGYKRPIIRDKFLLNMELNYHLLATSQFDSVFSSQPTIETVRTGTSFNRNFHLISVPVSVHLNHKLFRPGVGIEYYYKRTSPTNELILGTGQIIQLEDKSFTEFHGLSVVVGLQIPISERLNIDLKYARGVTNEEISSNNNGIFTTKMQRAEIGIKYRLMKKEGKELD